MDETDASVRRAGVSGLNHITLGVADITRSVTFYRDVLGFKVRALWVDGAHLEAGLLWLCLSRSDPSSSAFNHGYGHVAFSVSEVDFRALSERLIIACPIWQKNISEGASTYFLDPDGHQLEIHVGTLDTRLNSYRDNPSFGVTVIDDQ